MNMLSIYARSFYDFQEVKNEFAGRLRAAEEIEEFPEERKKELDDYRKKLESAEAGLLKIIKPYLFEYPVYGNFLLNIRGCAERMSACLITSIKDIKKFPTVSKLWAYSGLHLIDGAAVKRKKGEKAYWNGFLKSKLYVLAGCLIKQNFDAETHEPLKYRKLYDDYKHRMTHRDKCHLTKEQHAKSKDASPTWLANGCTKGHVENMAMRYLEKMFLQDLWLAWYEAEGVEPPTRPYAEAILGKKHHEYA